MSDILENNREQNKLFGRFLAENKLIVPNDIIVEHSSRVEDSICVNLEFDGYSRIIYSSYFPSIKDVKREVRRLEHEDGDFYQINYISNGFNRKIRNFNSRFNNSNIFNIGICSSYPDEFQTCKLNLVKYEKFLLAKGIHVHHLETVLENDSKIYVLTNRGI
jgi:hypothetical protein